MKDKINFIIAGAQKSSTSYLASVLNNHPEIYIPEGEISYFQNPDFLEGNEGDLHEYFQSISENLTWGIKRPGYLSSLEVPGNIFSYSKDVKIIFILRDPVERAISSLFHNMKYGFIPIENPNKLLRKILDDNLSGYPRKKEVLEYSLYNQYLMKWYQIFPSNQIFLITQEELLRNKLKSINQLNSFLGCHQLSEIKEPILRKQESIYSIKRLKWINKRNRYLYDYNEDNSRLFPKKTSLIGKLLGILITIIDRFFLKYILQNDKSINKETKELLSSKLKEDVLLLEKSLPAIKQYWKNFY